MRPVRALLFHDVYRRHPDESGFEGEAASRYKLELDAFRAQLDALRSVPLPCPLAAVPAAAELTGGASPLLLFTVDDGGASYRSIVADELEERGWRGTCFVTTGRIGGPGFLDAADLRALHARGHGIGSHSVSHPLRFDALAPAAMAAEWRESRERLEDVLGAAVRAGSVPGGWYGPAVAEAAAAAGLEVLCTSEPVTRPWRHAGVWLLGRFTLRRGAAPTAAAELAAGRRLALGRAWLAWNGKKIARRVLGTTYARLAHREAA